ncbi:MAG: DNA-directed RNA polymerase subunit K [Thermoprotei archaeon]|nr:MAG: DNA-directed RNA polymerase subunit K [Thermoprotei archaeon]RLF17836.1 MAG: DNA-directed RNA polymerase subunit K [Thermoprotei archaeon]
MKAEEVKVWLPRLTRYEKARIIGARALQISMGAPVLIAVPPEGMDPIKIASMELELGLLPMTIRRRLPNGRYQDIPLSWLLKGRPASRGSG